RSVRVLPIHFVANSAGVSATSAPAVGARPSKAILRPNWRREQTPSPMVRVGQPVWPAPNRPAACRTGAAYSEAMAEPAASAPDQLARLNERYAAVSRRIDELDAAWREANEAKAEARAAVVAAEREGVSRAERQKLEKALAVAEARASEPWTERV